MNYVKDKFEIKGKEFKGSWKDLFKELTKDILNIKSIKFLLASLADMMGYKELPKEIEKEIKKYRDLEEQLKFKK